jgi:hypothetical protein
MAADTMGFLGAGFGMYAGYQFQGAFHRSEYVPHEDILRLIPQYIPPLGPPDTPDYPGFSEGDKKLFQITVGNTGIFRDYPDTAIFLRGKQGHIQKGLQGIPALC